MGKQKFLFSLIISLCSITAFAQKTVTISKADQEHFFLYDEVQWLEDTEGKLTIDQVKSAAFDSRFSASKSYYPKNYHQQSFYWYRIKVKFKDSLIDKQSVIEFFDQTTDHITAYLPDANGKYLQGPTGASFDFGSRLYRHKNFEFLINAPVKGEHTYYFRVKSHNLVNVIMVYRTVNYFIHYALNEYITFGIFYGMILIFCFHNLLMFLAVKKKQYLYYVLYILSVGIYEMSTDGIAFQYFWPRIPDWNVYAYGTALYLVSIFALIFTRELLQVKTQSPRLNRIILYTIGARTLFFLFCVLINQRLFIYKFVEIVPLMVAFCTGIIIYSRGFKAARFFVLGYTILFIGVSFKALYVAGLWHNIPRPLGYYSLGLCFVLEMVLLSFSIGDQVRLLRREKDAATDETIRQMDINVKLKESINQELEHQVKIRTSEVVEKSKELQEQSAIIAQQNMQLLTVNKQLEQQAEEISRMNVLLEKDNTQLKTNIEKVTDARALSTELSFEEFSAKYPDQETCYKFLAELKWVNGYQCTRCTHDTYCNGRAAYSRRCTKCAYEESVLHNTIFHNNRIPINKAFYLVYLMYTSKGTISSYKLSTKLDIRQSTCWAYAIRIKKAMKEQKKDAKKDKALGWSKLVLEVA